ncbi:MAG: beta-ketoacyl-[acyl-carrier-protein] synthase family protein [Limisphaerales bacterium]|jgi:3-oxoacyl-[acyl-carrier-protein] synthase II
MNKPRRVAITGVGMVTPVGLNATSTWNSLLASQSGIRKIQGFDASGFPTQIGAEVKGFNPDSLPGDRKLLKYAARAHLFAFSAAEEALADAGIRPTPQTANRWGCSLGAGMMGVTYEELETVQRVCAPQGEFQPEKLTSPEFPVDPVAFCRTQTNAGLAIVTQRFGIQGYATAVHTACASGGQAVGTALKILRRGLADCVLTGGFDSMLNPMGLSAFCLLGALSTDNDNPERASRPFDVTRNGFVLGEGAGFLVLEDWDHAQQRGARIYAELAGDGNSLSSYRITDSHPSGDGPIQAMHQALHDAQLTPADIDYINAHGTSTPMNDRSECAAIRSVLGDHTSRVSVSSTKSCMGHLIAAAGAVEAGVCALAIHHGIAPVNANWAEPDPNCDVNLVLKEPKHQPIRAILSNSLGFGGSNSCLAFRHPNGGAQ